MTISNLMQYLLSVQEAISYLKIGGVDDNPHIINDIIEAVSNLKDVFPDEKDKIEHMSAIFIKAKQSLDLPEDISDQFQVWGAELAERLSGKSQTAINDVGITHVQKKCDMDFMALVNKVATADIGQLLAEASKGLESYSDKEKSYYDLLRQWYKSWYRIETFKDTDPSFANYFGAMYQYLKNNAIELKNFYQSLCDYRSKYSLMKVLQHWLIAAPDLRSHGVEHTFLHYYDLDLISCGPDEVFVDCGAFIGDSAINFIETFGTEYKRIYAYELTPKTYQKMKKNLSKYDNIVCRNVGVADKNGSMSMINIEGSEAGNRLVSGDGTSSMPIVSLDNDIKEDITFIKMDIEGAEIAAIKGARNHIKRSHPKLAISLYHSLPHLLEVPALVHRIYPHYKFYFRHTGGITPGGGGVPFPTEYILIAI